MIRLCAPLVLERMCVAVRRESLGVVGYAGANLLRESYSLVSLTILDDYIREKETVCRVRVMWLNIILGWCKVSVLKVRSGLDAAGKCGDAVGGPFLA